MRRLSCRVWPRVWAAVLTLSFVTPLVLAGATSETGTDGHAARDEGPAEGGRETAGVATGDTASAVAFVICDERTGETGRVVTIEWVGRIDDRKQRCD
jgi:hypothetical protein